MILCMCAFPFLVHVSPPLMGRLVGAASLAALLSGRDGPLLNISYHKCKFCYFFTHFYNSLESPALDEDVAASGTKRIEPNSTSGWDSTSLRSSSRKLDIVIVLGVVVCC